MKSDFNKMAFGIYGITGTIEMFLVPQMPIVPSANQIL